MTLPRIAMIAALSVAAAWPANAQGAPLASDLSYVAPIPGRWIYTPASDGSQAAFYDANSRVQLTIRCIRSSRRVAILKPAAAAAPSLWVWTSSRTNTVPATFDTASLRVRAEMNAYDPLLDAMAASRGRVGFSTAGLSALVVPPWAEVGRVIEDCRV